MSDSSLQATALRLITKKGRPVTLLRRVTTTAPADPAKPWMGSSASTLSCSTVGVWIDPLKSTQDYQFAEKIEPQSAMRRYGWDLMIPAKGLTFTPEQGDYVRDSKDGREYKVVTLSPMEPGLVPFFLTLQVQL